MTAAVVVHILLMARLATLNEVVTHPGTVVVIFYYLYCIVPTLFFLTGTTEGALFQWQSYSDEELSAHLMRSAVFIFFLLLAINLFPHKKDQSKHKAFAFRVTGGALASCFSLLIIPALVLAYLSAPVYQYYDFYTRFDHLTGALSVLASLCKRLVWGMTPITIFLLSARYADSIKMYLASVGIVIVFLSISSYGSRIDAMLAIVQAICFRSLWAKKQIRPQHFLAFFPFLAISLYLLRYVELIRLGSDATLNITMSNALQLAPNEFFALFFPSIDLYRLNNLQLEHDFTIYLKDILSVVPFLNVGELDLMYWYWKTFVPSAQVAPYTMGVLADPAILGEWWLILEAVVIGRLAVWINNLRQARDPYRLAAFGYLSSVGVLVLKYHMLTYVDLLINNFIPAALIMWLILRLQERKV